MYRTALLSILFALPTASVPAQTAQDSADVRALIDRYRTALRTRNAASMRGDYTPMAQWLDASGVLQVGPDSIVAYTSRVYADSTFAASILTRDGPDRWYFVRPDVAYVQYYHRRETGRPAVGTFPPIQDIMTTLLLSRENGQWLIQQETNLELHLPDLFAGSSASARGAYTAAEVDEEVKQRDCKAPAYPPGMSISGLAPFVSVRYVVGTDGAVDVASIHVVTSSGKAFEQPAIDAILSCDVTPAKIKGAPVRQIMDQVVRFIRSQPTTGQR